MYCPPVRLTLLATLLSAAASSAFAGETTVLDEVTVTGTREARPVAETPATVSTLDAAAIDAAHPTHPRDLLNQVPGVWVSNLSGEGHSTAIRQGLTTSPVYLYLEDGIPTRSTGFFNHNALYEVDIPQAGGMEVTKGPGSALYGSDAIGGTVNVLTRTPPAKRESEVTAEGGSWGWARLMLTAGDSRGDDAWRASLNATHTDGWQEAAGYDRQTGTLRWDRALGDTSLLKSVFSFSVVDQTHVGSLNAGEFAQTPRRNNIPFSYRQVKAFRLSTAWEREAGNTLLSLTPYLRDNRMEIIPSWTVGYDPNRYVTENVSAGLLAKYRIDFQPLRTRLITGVDIDYSPGSRDEQSIALTKTTNAQGGTTYAINNTLAPVEIYDYDVTYTGVSPYLHIEFSPLDPLRVTAGVRYDHMTYDYQNHLNGGTAGATQGVGGAFPGNGWYGHVASTKVDYDHTSPKLGATWRFGKQIDAFANWSTAFRAPSEGNVFRGSREGNAVRAQAAAQSLLDLDPVKVDSTEAGVRAGLGKASASLSVYRMNKKDDIVSYMDPATSQRVSTNAGNTRHEGVELGADTPVIDGFLRVGGGIAWAEHRYQQWVVAVSGVNKNYSGNDIESAPRTMGNLRVVLTPALLAGGRLQLEWVHLGNFWLDQANTGKYGGHELLNLAVNRPFGKQVEVYANVRNLTDERFAETASGTGAAPQYSAGLPLTANVGVALGW